MFFNYTLTKEEFIDFHKKYILTSIKFNKFLIENFLTLGLFFYYTYFYTIPISNICNCCLCRKFFNPFLLRKRWYLNCLKRKKFKNLHLYYNLKYIFTETNLKIDKKGIFLETIFNKKIIKWKYINDLYIIDNNVLIRSFSDYNILIPASAINSNDDLENLIEIFRENTSKYPQYSYPKDIEFI